MSDDDSTIIGDYVWDRALARTVDRLSTEQFHIPALVLMENAGRGVAEALLAQGCGDGAIIVLAGLGNNGGDALVAARYLAEAGHEVHVFLVPHRPDAAPSDACRQQIKILEALGQAPRLYQFGALQEYTHTASAVIDGLLGLGFSGVLAEDSLTHQALSEATTLRDAVVIAIDVPSGIDADRGDAQNIPLPASMTVTFGGVKPCHVLSPARDCSGEVACLDIGFPSAAEMAAFGTHRPMLMLPDADELIADNPWESLPGSAHKFDRGHVLVIGGSAGKTGAPLLAAMAALRTGAGWTSVAMPASAFATLKGEVPREITFESLFDGDRLNAINLARFLEERHVRAVIAGPGAVTNPLTAETLAVLADWSAENEGFVILDAGAVHGIAPLLANIDVQAEHWLLTPHPGEWRRLGDDFDDAPLTPVGLKRATLAAERMGATLLYKHATPMLITGSPKSPAFVITAGTVALARAGSGDVLAGVIGAHGAIGVTTAKAALRAQVLVARAADLAARAVGPHAVLARDIIDQIGNVTVETEEPISYE